MADKFIRPRQIKDYTGTSEMTVRRAEKRGEFPPRRKITPGAVGWLESEILEWQKNRAGSLVKIQEG